MQEKYLHLFFKKLLTHYKLSCYTRTNTWKTRRKYTIGNNLSRFFSKKILLIFFGWSFWKRGRGLKFDKQILNHVSIFCNNYFQIFLTRFQEKCNTFFRFSLHEFSLSVKKNFTVILLEFHCGFDTINIRDE